MGDMADQYDPDGSARHAMRFGGPVRRTIVLHGEAARRAERAMKNALGTRTELAPWDPDPRFPTEPPVGSVLRWTVQYDTGRELTVVGLRVAPGWYLSTNVHQGPMLWSRVRALIGDFPCSVAVEWGVIPQPEPEPSGDDAVRAWAERYRPLGMVAERGTPVNQADRPSWSVSTDGERAAERDAADLTVAAAEREAERPEPRYDADGRDRGGWTPAELGDTDAVEAQEDADRADRRWSYRGQDVAGESTREGRS